MCFEEIRKARLSLGRGGDISFSLYPLHTIMLLDYYSVSVIFMPKNDVKNKNRIIISQIFWQAVKAGRIEKIPHIFIIYKFLILSYLFRGGEEKVWVLFRGQ